MYSRIYKKIDEQLNDTQFGFKKNVGTRHTLFGTNVLIERHKAVTRPLFICLVDF